MNNPFYSWSINPRNVPGWVTPELEDKIVKAIKSGESQLKIAIRLTSEIGREIQPYLIQYVSWKNKLSTPKKKINEELRDLIKKLVSEGKLATEIAEQIDRHYGIKISRSLIGKLGKEVCGLKNKVGKLTDEQALEMIIRVRTMEAEKTRIEQADLSRRNPCNHIWKGGICKKCSSESLAKKCPELAKEWGL